jgi:hypothetical protein
MRNILFTFFSIFSFTIALAQTPGGVPQPDMWGKVRATNTAATTFQYKDFCVKNRPIIVNAGLTPSLFNYNYSYMYTASGFASFLSKIESLKDATIFIVNQPEPPPPTTPTTLQALMNTAWAPAGTPVTGTNEHAFEFNTTNFVNNTNTASGASSGGAKINTVVWHNFNSRNMVHSYGTNGESTVFVGRRIGSVINFEGQIPEFIIYRRALNDKEKLRVESYLALKYGITLDAGFNYVNSKYEPFWHQTNNALFGNRIFGIGRDDNSNLYQKQAASSHLPNKLVYWSATNGTVSPPVPSTINTPPKNNFSNSTTFENQNFITIGDDNGLENPNIALTNGIQRIERIWLAERFGGSIHDKATSIRYQPTVITLAPEQAFWMLIDRNATNMIRSTFNGSDVEVIPIINLTGGATFPNIKLATDTSIYSQFTFGVGPRMIVNALPQTIACESQIGRVDFSIKGGLPVFTVNVNGVNLNGTGAVVHNSQISQSSRDFFLDLPLGNYTVSVTDATGFTQGPILFVVDPKPGMRLELGPERVVLAGNTTTLNGAANMNPALTISYAWTFTPAGGGTTVPFSTLASITVSTPGLYTCVAENMLTHCILTDSITIKEPIMTITATTVPFTNCTATTGTVNFLVTNGYPNYTVNISGTTISGAAYTSSVTQTAASFAIGLIPTGSYTATITDSTGYFQTANFVLNPIQGMLFDLGLPQSILTGTSVPLDATVAATPVTYSWTYVGSGSPILPSTATFSVSVAGTYTCTVYNPATTCSVTDSVVITVIPNMTISVTPVHNSCTDGIANFVIQDGLPNYTVNIHGTNAGNTYNNQVVQTNLIFSSVPLNAGTYLATITDASGYIQTANFTINPLAGMILDLGPDQIIPTGSVITLDASTNITATAVGYEWNYSGPGLGGIGVLNPFSANPIVTTIGPGEYTCIVTDSSTNCSVADVIIISNPPPPIANSSQVYPNPSTGKFKVKIDLDGVKDVDISICDVSGKALIKDYLNGFKQYETQYELKTTGVYFVKIIAKDYTTTHKLIIN